jgi:peptidoglycan/xylan/chitin deacetylase (PgdA/CDA1 family)
VNSLFTKVGVAAFAAALLSTTTLSAQGTSARILMFHDVSFTDGKTAVSDDVYPDNFRDMMEFLKRNYNVISMDQFIAWRQGIGSIPTNAVVITFDDNYEGTHDFALPIMRELGQVGINFAHTGFVGVLTSKDHADWNELRGQQAEGVLNVESHTINHPNLTTLSDQTNEIVGSKSAIQAQISGKTVKYIAYPFGAYNSSTISIAQGAGYVAGVTTIGGLNTSTTPYFELRRNGVGIDIRLKDFKSIMGYTGSDPNGPIILDNADTTGINTTGTWSTIGTKTTNYGQYGNTYRRASRSTTQSATARYTPTLTAGFHDVFTWVSSESDPYLTSADVTHRIAHKTGTTTKVINQRVNKAGWVYLGRFDFNSGTGGYVEISNAGTTGTYVSADAVKFQKVTSGAPAPVETLILDNGTSAFTTSGSWTTSTSGFPYGANCVITTGTTGSANKTATWSGTIARNGWYEVGVWFTTSNSTFRSNAAPFTVTHADGSNTVLVNQQSTSTNQKRFVSLGTFRFTAGTKPLVTLANNINSTTQYVSADAIIVDWVANSPTAAVEVVVDNTDAGFTASTNWTTSSANPGYLGSNYRTRPTASVSDAAKWNVNLPSAGNYEVYARWTADGTRATSTPYIITHTGGNTTVNANQTLNNGAWVSLGTYNFTSGAADRVQLSCWTSSGSNVVADGVRFVKR